MESSVAAPGTKVPLAGADPGRAAAGPAVAALRDVGTLGPTPGGSPRLLQAARGYRPGATMGLSSHDRWLEAVSVQVTGD